MGKERYEWVQSWCDEADRDGRRVLLVGDSIARGYQEFVRARLRGKCLVDYFSTSYAADMPIFRELLTAFVKDSKYDIIHFNNGLHGLEIKTKLYKESLKRLLSGWRGKAKVILATTTFVCEQDNAKPKTAVNRIVAKRNLALRELAEEFGWTIDDLYTVSVQMPAEKRNFDGTHYEASGYELLAECVAESIGKNL